MRIHALLLAVVGGFSGCATYSQDLERARRHYQDLEFAKTLAVLRVLGEDPGALSASERIQYAYLRGMTDLRIADTLPPDNADREAFRACARDWLDESLELDRQATASLTPEQGSRARAALAQLLDVEQPKTACINR